MAWSKAVFSSTVNEVGWSETEGLVITWKSGKRSVYEGVPEHLADELSRAPSVGRMFHNEIKDRYPHRYQT
jgi:hypothetical protein